jgi:hypothetical protein
MKDQSGIATASRKKKITILIIDRDEEPKIPQLITNLIPKKI